LDIAGYLNPKLRCACMGLSMLNSFGVFGYCWVFKNLKLRCAGMGLSMLNSFGVFGYCWVFKPQTALRWYGVIDIELLRSFWILLGI